MGVNGGIDVPVSREVVDKPKIWGGVTDPNRYDPKKFRFSVYGINPFAKMTVTQTALEAHERGTEMDKTQGDQSIDLFVQPERVAERVALSTSLIDQNHLATWGDVGLIVELPQDNVVITATSDFGTISNNVDILKRQAALQPVTDGDDLLSRSSTRSYNEVVALGTDGDKRIELKGFFYKIDSNGKPVDQYLATQMESQGSRLKLPVVRIQAPNPYDADQVSQENGRLGANFHGKNYQIEGFEKGDFLAKDQFGSSKFMSPDQAEGVLSYLLNEGVISSEHRDQLMGRYQTADQARQKPRILYKDGQITGVRKLVGYGEDEEIWDLDGSGYSTIENVDKKNTQIIEALMGKAVPTSGLEEKRLNGKQADILIAEAVAGLEPEEAQRVNQWYEQIKPEVQRRSGGWYGQIMSKIGDSSEEIDPELVKRYADMFKAAVGEMRYSPPPPRDLRQNLLGKIKKS